MSTLFAWARRFAERDGAAPKAKRGKSARFAEVRVVEDRAQSGGSLEVVAPSGYVVRVRGPVDREALAAVLEVLGKC